MLSRAAKSRIFFWILSNIAVQIFVPIIYGVYLSFLLDYEYENKIRTSTGGDIILIPVIGMFVLIFLVLVAANVFITIFYLWTKHRAKIRKQNFSS